MSATAPAPAAVPASKSSISDTRRHQMIPILEPAEIERVRRFGKIHAYTAGEALAQVGAVANLMIILSGKVQSTQRDQSGHDVPIHIHGRGSFMGELAQLAGRPSLVDARAQEPVEALIMSPGCLRA